MSRLACCLLLAVPALSATAQRLDTLGAAVVAAPFADARALGVDPAGRLYVADGTGAIAVLGPDGTPLRLLGGTDRAPLYSPSDLDPTNGLVLLVADAAAGRIYRFGEGGIVLESLGWAEAARLGAFGSAGHERAFTPVAVASDARNSVFAVDGVSGRLLRWDLSRQVQTLSGPDEGVLAIPKGLAVTGDRLYVLDANGVVAFDAFGTPVRRFAALHAPAAVRLRATASRLVLVLPAALVLYNLEGGLENVLTWAGEPLRDVAITPEAVFLLTRQRLYRVTR